ncbi:MAG: carboxymuconolactone decarboxylase, partial [Candidatus Rokuibacteriota bacterium]
MPQAHLWATGLNHYLRDESSLPKKIQELAMLVTARELDCQHIWNAHAASARKAGVRSEIVDALRDRKELPVLAADEAAVVNY